MAEIESGSVSPGASSNGIERALAALALAIFLLLAAFDGAAQQATDEQRATKALFEAVQQNSLAKVQASLAAGADLSAANEWGLTAVDLAIDKGYFEIAHFLLSVRDFRKSAAEETPRAATTPKPPPPPAPSPAPPVAETVAAPPAVPPPSPETPAVAAAEPAPAATPWPAGKPNPFDPEVTPPGATLSVIGEVRAPTEGTAPTMPDQISEIPATVAEPVAEPPAKPVERATRPSSEKGFLERMLDVFRPQPDQPTETAEPPPQETPPAAIQPVTAQPLPPQPPQPPQPMAKPAVEEPPGEAAEPAAEAKPVSADPMPPRLPQPTAEPRDLESGQQLAETPAASPDPLPPSGDREIGFFERILRVFLPGDSPSSGDRPVETAALPAVEKTPEKVELPAPRPAEKAPSEPEGPPGSPDQGGFFDRLFDFFRADERPQPDEDVSGETEEAAAPRISSEVEMAPLAPVERPEPPQDAADDDALGRNGEWSVTGVESAQLPASLPGRPKPSEPPANALDGTILTIGKSLRLGAQSRNRNPGPDGIKPCVEKKRKTISFCIEAVDWPVDLRPYVRVDSIMYQGAKTIGRYDNGMATYYHTIFPSVSYEAVVGFYRRRFGDPTEYWKRSIAPLAAPRRENPTVIWRSVNPVTKLISTLEVRKFDDARGSFPDIKRGAILLYHEWSTPVFPQLSTLELMLLRASMLR